MKKLTLVLALVLTYILVLASCGGTCPYSRESERGPVQNTYHDSM